MTTHEQFKVFYVYDPDTGEYDHMYRAQLSPEDDHSNGPVYLSPVHSTDVAPPSVTAPNQARVFRKKGWSLQPDYRGQTVYAKDGSRLEVTVIGPLPNGASLEPPPPTAEQRRTALMALAHQRMHEIAARGGYAGAADCVSYVNSTNPAFKKDAAAFGKWRDAVQTLARALEDPLPSDEQFLASLPEAPW